MIFTIDRLQFIDDLLICFEFVDIDDDSLKNKGYNHAFFKEKISILKNIFNSGNFFLVQYSVRKNCYNINRVKNYTSSEFVEWFNELNYKSKVDSNRSKPLGSATNNEGDPYVASLLNAVYSNDLKYIGVKFDNDDNGLHIVKEILKDNSTFGFDFDLFESTNKVVIEFLKRENAYVSNLTAHPNRYVFNYKKFQNLWKAAKFLNSKIPMLFLVNYSDNVNENISLIKVLDIDESENANPVIISDIGYKLENKFELIKWLKILSQSPDNALQYLDKFPKEERFYDFWKEFKTNSKIVKSKIGKNYK